MSKSLIDDAVHVTADTLEKAVEHLALACARGPVQMGVVFELITEGTVGSRLVRVPGQYRWNNNTREPIMTRVYGTRPIGYDSWKNLKNRLAAAGFIIKRDRDLDGTETYRAYWSPTS